MFSNPGKLHTYCFLLAGESWFSCIFNDWGKIATDASIKSLTATATRRATSGALAIH